MASAISIQNVSKTFHVSGKTIPALSNVSLDIEQGAFVSLLGPSGCGKSTLLRVIGDLLDSDEGSVQVLGKEARKSRQDRDYGMVFQQPGLMDWRTIQKNVELPMQVAGVGKAERAARAKDLLQLVRLEGFEGHRPRQLSGGMQQRAAIARALSFEPKILLMDEPLGALDEMNREHMQRELLRIWRETGTTIVFVTHSVSEAAFLSTEVVVMSPRPGRIATRIPIDLPFPRTDETRSTEKFYEVETQVREALHAVLEPTVTGV
ncbi:ABC transporter ATP-binding protein [Leucobacter luti]|uniref:NitT/TauT family transport system ATP-binding protein n=1 Tax=Leucobacter luti TaxID=340320 RepID=A0A4Q7U2L8_9MICO|nr:ABC transporter ATP-binding protein [Leucobacter luti]MBL3699497.1 ABC transporter ATP-binding protein [Leucobacter luti]RZT67007.1 NitT/TauT family transport system ATP-binding protein [Leucobacter luti]